MSALVNGPSEHPPKFHSLQYVSRALLDGQVNKQIERISACDVKTTTGNWCSPLCTTSNSEEAPIDVDTGHGYILAATSDGASTELFLLSGKRHKFLRRYYYSLRDPL